MYSVTDSQDPRNLKIRFYFVSITSTSMESFQQGCAFRVSQVFGPQRSMAVGKLL